MHTFGITGSIACGKSTVTKYLRKAGIPIVDADIIAREVVEPGTIGLSKVTECFGQDVLHPDGSVNRPALGALVFGNQEALDKLNSILGPIISDEADKQIKAYHDSGYELVGYDAALIIEKGNLERFRPLVVVKADPETQLLRLIARNSLTLEEAQNRISKQLSSEEKSKYADFIIETNGTLEELERNTLATLQDVKAFVKGYKAGREINSQ